MLNLYISLWDSFMPLVSHSSFIIFLFFFTFLIQLVQKRSAQIHHFRPNVSLLWVKPLFNVLFCQYFIYVKELQKYMDGLVVLIHIFTSVQKRREQEILLFVKLPNYLTPFFNKLLHSFYSTWLQKSNHLLSEFIEFFVIAFSQSEQVNDWVWIGLLF